MTNQYKEMLQQAVDQIDVPESEVKRALTVGLQEAQKVKSKRWYLGIEVGVVVAAAACFLLMLRFTSLMPEEDIKPAEEQIVTSSVTSIPEFSISSEELMASDWRTSDWVVYSFDSKNVQLREQNQENVFYEYRLTDDTLQLTAETPTEVTDATVITYSYKLAKEGESIRLTPLDTNGETITLMPIYTKNYTEEEIAGLTPAEEPDLTAYEWLRLDSVGASNFVVFDGETMRNATDPSDPYPGFYTISGNEIYIEYDVMGGLQSHFGMYWDNGRLVFWPADENDHKEERQMVYEPME